MAVALDSVRNVTAGTGNLSWTHGPFATLRAVIVQVVQDVGTTNEVTSVTFGSLTLTEAAGSPNIHSTGEPGVVYTYTSVPGDSIPNGGAQTVTVTVNATGSVKRAVSTGLTADADVEIVDIDATIRSDSLANPSVTLSLAGRTSFCCIAFHSGQNAITGITPLTDWTETLENDFGTKTAGWYRYNIIGTADVTAGWTQAADDAVMIALAMSEVAFIPRPNPLPRQAVKRAATW